MTTNSPADFRQISLDGEITIYRAAEIKSLLLDAVAQDLTLEIDLGQVSEIDTSGVQLLMLAKRAAQARERDVRLVGHSPAVIEVFELLNLSSFFGDTILAAPGRA
jgi:anti-anti-sigma factor